ncbi:hypothetical protein J4573_44930 [Actinomadura barringtoniae]|uniref:Uncharacterized protein n=1 Tax=Actinomadura barringtoniae TaxID=1427535 RepID=A0A939TC86_9ACTN|nr:hypothetical protein [Actinomadura barringtoniae]MBO2454297.1 hypothetical protein [Actinomadura barringtoniae]
MTALPLANSLMDTASTEAAIAGSILPPALMINFEFKLSKGDPETLDKAGQAWRKASDQINQVMQKLQDSVSGIGGQDWTAEDRPAYEKKVQEFTSQLQVLSTYCMVVGIALTTLAYALLVYAIFAVGMGTFLGALAIEAAAALAVPVVGEADYAAALGIAATCLTITSVATGVLAAAGQLAGAAFAGGSLVAATVEYSRGNDQAFSDWAKAQEVGAAGAAANLLQNAGNAGLDFLNRGGGKSGKGFPVTAVDADADRGWDKTWSVGGGATVDTKGGGSVDASGHVKVGDHGIQGADGDVKVTGKGGTEVEGKGGWDEDADGNDTYSGGLSGKTKGGAHAGAEGEYGDDGHWKGKVDGGYEKGNSDTTGSAGVDHDKDGNTKYTGEAGNTYRGVTTGSTNQEVSTGDGGTQYKGSYTGAGGAYDSEKPPWES